VKKVFHYTNIGIYRIAALNNKREVNNKQIIQNKTTSIFQRPPALQYIYIKKHYESIHYPSTSENKRKPRSNKGM
jgi:hypothetical protein